MRRRLCGQHIDQPGKACDRLSRRVATVQPQVERDLVVARPARVKGRAGGRDLREPALYGGVDVLVCCLELEVTGVELAPDPAQAALDGGQPRRRKQARGFEPTGVRDAPLDVVRV